MTSASRTEQDVRHVVALRCALALLPEGPEKASVRRVERELRRGLGVAVPKRVAARVLGISVTALDRWLEKGKLVEAHVPGTGRAQVEAWSLVQVALAAEQARADGVPRNAVAESIHRLEAAGRLPFRARPNEHPLILRRDFLDSTPEQRLAEIDSLVRGMHTLFNSGLRKRKDPHVGALPVLQLRSLLTVLAEHEVEHVVIGSIAVGLHGAWRGAVEIDIAPRSTTENLARLWEAVESIEPQPQENDGTADRVLHTTLGRIDIMQWVAPFEGYDDLIARAATVDLDDIPQPVHYAGLDDLILMKQEAGRPQDLIDITALRLANGLEA